jgi:hypothetical protein
MSLVDDVDTDFVRWESRLSPLPKYPQRKAHPHPHEPNGLPEGWRIWSTYADFHKGVDRLLVRRFVGDWMILTHQRADQMTAVVSGGATVASLYRQPLTGRGLRWLDDIQTRQRVWLRKVIVSAYDPTDPVEDSERVLVALGGPVMVFPHILS